MRKFHNMFYALLADVQKSLFLGATYNCGKRVWRMQQKMQKFTLTKHKSFWNVRGFCVNYVNL